MEPLVESVWFLKELYINPERGSRDLKVLQCKSRYVFTNYGFFMASMMSILLVFTIQNECEGLRNCIQISAGFSQRSLAFLIVIACSSGS